MHGDRGADARARRLRRASSSASARKQGVALHAARCSASSRSTTCRRRAGCGSSASRTSSGFEVGQSLDGRRSSRRASTSTCRASPRAAASRAWSSATASRPATPRTARPHGKQPGSIGASAYPSRVVKGKRLPGRMGGVRLTTKNLEVVAVDAEQNVLLVRGAVPGPAERPRARARSGSDEMSDDRRRRSSAPTAARRARPTLPEAAVRPAGARAPALARR